VAAVAARKVHGSFEGEKKVTNPLRVYIGYDRRESEAYEVARDSLLRHASRPVVVTALRLAKLEECGVLTRPWTIKNDQMWDVISDAPQSTEFAISRFAVPILAQEGPAVFMDSDVVVHADIHEMVRYATGKTGAVFVCKHQYTPREQVKMDGQAQTQYARKNWSSVMLFNCDHPANRKLSVELINAVAGRDLHRFCWLKDWEINSLPLEWNWLVGVEPKPEQPKISHFTLGGPWLRGWKEREHDQIWLEAKRLFNMRQDQGDFAKSIAN
jgi:hypothetical protein